MIAKKKELLQQIPRSRPNKKCFNYGKKVHYARDCSGRTNLKRKLKDKKTEQKAKRTREKKHQTLANQTSVNKVAIARSNPKDKKLDYDLYPNKRAFMIQEANMD